MGLKNRVPLGFDIPILLANVQRAFGASPEGILDLSCTFEAAGEEIALVGGPVRDVSLGVMPNDFDLTTSVEPERTEEFLAQQGMTVQDIGKEFGTIDGRKKDLAAEMTTYRSDSYKIDSRKPEVTFGDTLEGDLARRGFTVSIMTMRSSEMVLVDPCHGLEDLAKACLRTLVTTEQSFDDDLLRIMRATCFTAQLGIGIDLDVMEAMGVMAPRLQIVPVERIRAELEHLIVSSYLHHSLGLTAHTGVCQIVLPKPSELASTVDEHRRHKDVYERTSTVFGQAVDLETDEDGPVSAPDFILHFTMVMHDANKLIARHPEPNGTMSFHHHGIVGAKLTRKCMKALKPDKTTTEAMSTLIALYLRLHGHGESAWTDLAVRCYVADVGGPFEHLHHLTRTDCTTRSRHKADIPSVACDDLEPRITALRGQEKLGATRPDPGGQEVTKILGLRPSRVVEMTLKSLMGVRVEKGPMRKEAARGALPKWWSSKGA